VAGDLFSLALYTFLILAVASGGLVTSMLIGKRKKGFMKEEPYECGVPQIGETRTEFNVRFFVLSMLFVLFDIETVLLAPYAMTFLKDVGRARALSIWPRLRSSWPCWASACCTPGVRACWTGTCRWVIRPTKACNT